VDTNAVSVRSVSKLQYYSGNIFFPIRTTLPSSVRFAVKVLWTGYREKNILKNTKQKGSSNVLTAGGVSLRCQNSTIITAVASSMYSKNLNAAFVNTVSVQSIL